MQTNSAKNTIVLLGIGHTNAHILKSWKMDPIKDCQLICVSNFPVSTYSGMLPGVLAGQYPLSAMEIDAVRLCASANVRLVIGNVTGIDTETNRIQFANRPDLAFDWLSIGVGSRPSFKGVEIKEAASVVGIKPMQTFNERLHASLGRMQSQQTVSIAIVGGGIGSIEIAFCLDRHLQAHPERKFRLKLVAGKSGVGSGLLESTRAKVLERLADRSIEVIEGQRVSEIDGQQLVLDDDKTVKADLVLWATNAIAPEVLESLNLEKDDRGFLATRPTLQTVSADQIFAVGDTGTILNESWTKRGSLRSGRGRCCGRI